MDPEELKNLEESLLELSRIISSQSGSMTDHTELLKQFSTDTKAENTSLNENSAANDKMTGTENALTAREDKAAAIIAKAAENNKTATTKGRIALEGLTSALLGDESGLSKYGKVVNSVGEATFAVSKNFGVPGAIIGVTALLLGKTVKAVFALDDNLVKSRDSFTKAGGMTNMTLEHMGKLAKKAKFSLGNIKKLSDESNALGGDLRALGGPVGSAQENFFAMAKVHDSVRRSFGRLGVSQDDLMHLQALYVKDQAASGGYFRNAAVDDETRRKNSLEYAKNMVVLSTITGKTADALQEEINQVQLGIEEQAAEVAENYKIKKLEASNDPRDKAEAERLKLRQANRLEMIHKYTALFGKEKGMQMARVARLGYYDKMTKSLAGLPDFDALGVTQKINNSKNIKVDLEEGANKLDTALQKRTVESETISQYNPDMLTQRGVDPEYLKLSLDRSGKPAGDVLRDAYKAVSGKGEKGKDKLADNVEGVRSAEREAQAAAQTFLEIADPLRGGLLKTALVVGTVVAGLAGLAFAMKKYITFSSLGGGGAGGLGGASGPGGLGGGFPSLRKADVLDKNGKVLQGAALNSRIKKIGGAPASGASGGFSESLKAVLDELKSAGVKAPLIMAGGGALAVAVGALGLAFAGSAFLIGKGLKVFGEGIQAFSKVDGKNLALVGLGLIELTAGIVGLTMAAPIAGLMALMKFAGADPLASTANMLINLQKKPFDKDKIKNNSTTIMIYASTMVKVTSLSDSMPGKSKGMNAVVDISKNMSHIFAAISSLSAINNTQALINFVKAMSVLTDTKGSSLDAIAAGAMGGASIGGKIGGAIGGTFGRILGGAIGAAAGGAAAALPSIAGALGDIVSKIIRVESGGNATAQAKTSSAYGLGQLTKGTFEGIAKEKGSPVFGVSWEKYKSDPEVQKLAVAYLVQKDTDFLSKNKIPVSATSTYLSHFLGMGGVRQLYNHPNNTPISEAVSASSLNANRSVFSQAGTVGGLKMWAGKKMGDPAGVAQAKKGGMFGGPLSGYPMELHGTELVIPIEQNSVLMKLATMPENIMQDTQKNTSTKALAMSNKVTNTPTSKTSHGISKEMITSLGHRFDMVITTIEKSNKVNKKILKHSTV